MSREILVSVIIPAFNCENTIVDTLNSVKDQTIKNIEIIVINNNSSDCTLNKIKTINDKRIKVLNCYKQSPAASRNLGIKNASSKIIAFIDADDLWLKSKLEKSLNALEKFDFVYHDLYLYKKNNSKYHYKGIAHTRIFKNPVKKDLLEFGNGINTSSVVVKKDLLYKAGLFDENKNLFAAEDFDLWLRVSEHTERFKRMNDMLGKYIITGKNISNHNRRYTYTKELNRKYIDYIKTEFNIEIFPWMAYNLITSGFKINNFSNYDNYFKKVRFKTLSLRRKIILSLIFLIYLFTKKVSKLKLL